MQPSTDDCLNTNLLINILGKYWFQTLPPSFCPYILATVIYHYVNIIGEFSLLKICLYNIYYHQKILSR